MKPKPKPLYTIFPGGGGEYNWGGGVQETRVDPGTGLPIKRTPEAYRYSFDSYVEWIKPGMTREQAYHQQGSVYTDRLLDWDFAKTRMLIARHFPNNTGDYWSGRNPADIEAFLRDWMEDRRLVLTMIIACCNVSNGFPLWAFMWTPGKPEETSNEKDD